MDCDVSYEELAAFTAGDLAARRHGEINEHLLRCQNCRARLDALERADEALGELTPAKPSPSTLAATRRVLAQATGTEAAAQIMTLGQVARFLQISTEQLGEIVDTLPAFELAGQIRVRRAKLLEWIEQRERDHTRQAAASWAAQARSKSWQVDVA